MNDHISLNVMQMPLVESLESDCADKWYLPCFLFERSPSLFRTTFYINQYYFGSIFVP